MSASIPLQSSLSASAPADRRYVLALIAVIAALAVWRLASIAYYDHGLLVDEAQYIDWGRAPAFGYYSKPPMLAWTIAGARAACGEGPLCMRGLAVLLYSLAAACLFVAGRRLFDDRTGFVAACLYLLLPGIALTGLFITTDAPLALFSCAALMCAAGVVRWGRWRDWLALGACFGFGVMSKYSFGLFIAGFLLFLLVAPAHRKQLFAPRLWAALALAGLIVLPNVLWNMQHSFVTFTHTADISGLDRPHLSLAKFGEYLGAQLLVFGPVSFVGLLAAPWVNAGVLRIDAGRLLASIAFTVFGAFAALALLSRTLMNWAYVGFAPAILLVAAIWLRGRYQRTLWASAAVCLVLIVAAQHLPTWTRLAGIELPRARDPYSRMMGWRELGRGVSQAWARHPGTRLLADDRWIMAEMLYYVKPEPRDAAMWNPDGPVNDHYRLTRDAGKLAGADFMFVTSAPDISAMRAYFATVEADPDIVIQTHKDTTRIYHVYVLRGFKGYERGH